MNSQNYMYYVNRFFSKISIKIFYLGIADVIIAFINTLSVSEHTHTFFLKS
jgi:hypothetical protein